MTCECGFKGINCDQGRQCPLSTAGEPPGLKPGLSPQLLRNLAIYIALILGTVVACGVLSR